MNMMINKSIYFILREISPLESTKFIQTFFPQEKWDQKPKTKFHSK